MNHLFHILFLTLILCGCERKDSPQESSVSEALGARVIGYRFSIPGNDEPNTPRESGFSLINRSGALDQDLLRELKVKEALLTDDQVERLGKAVYGVHPVTNAAACYDPHHIFVFYDENGNVAKSVEICFSCLNIQTSPGLQESQWKRHDFRNLARLCDEIGIGMTSKTAEDFIKFWDSIDRLGSFKNEDNKPE